MIWIIVGLGLCLLEIFTPGFFVILFGISAIITGVCIKNSALRLTRAVDTVYCALSDIDAFCKKVSGTRCLIFNLLKWLT
jgi:membrane protein implicated in regulation of membrane protease activity